MPKPGAKERIRQFLLANIGNVVTSIQVRDAAGISVSEWAPRLRELRKDEDWPILTHSNSTGLKPGQYLLKEAPPEKSAVKFSRRISAKLRAAVLDRNDFTCQMCGLSRGEIDPYTGRKVRLQIGDIRDKSLGGKDELTNLRALCSTCNLGAKNITSEKPSVIWLLSQIRRAGQEEQRTVFESLVKKRALSGGPC
jgi:5-methylcytosine-specific restriction endonuclease McrA